MTETLLAFVALLLVIFFSMSQQRNIVETERELASIELEVLANAVGSDLMQSIAAMPFDAATRGEEATVNPQNPDLNGLTPTAEFGAANNCLVADECDDLDDFDGMGPAIVGFEVGRDEEDNPLTFNFSVTGEVTYVDENGVPTDARTWTKEVTLTVDQEVTLNETKYLLAPVVLKRRFSPQWGS